MMLQRCSGGTRGQNRKGTNTPILLLGHIWQNTKSVKIALITLQNLCFYNRVGSCIIIILIFLITIILIILILKQMTAVWTTSASWAVRTERGGSARKLSTGNWIFSPLKQRTRVFKHMTRVFKHWFSNIWRMFLIWIVPNQQLNICPIGTWWRANACKNFTGNSKIKSKDINV